MKLNSNLLNEVIADAKAVRETAVQTAISRLKETFEPTVRSLISQKLREEEDIDDETETTTHTPEETNEEYSEDVYDDTSFHFDGLAEEEDAEQSLSDTDLEEILAELEGDSEEHDSIEEEEEEHTPEPEPTTEEDEEITVEALNRLIREMESEIESEPVEEEEEEETHTVSESWVNSWGQDEYDPNDDFESIYESLTTKKAPTSKLIQENRNLKRQLTQAKRQLKEAYRAITTQSTAINEVNLLNSKLLFLTKITSKHRMSPQKQVKILEAFDRAKTVREVKLVYATICESLDKAQNSKSFGIVESASKPTRTVKGNLNENYGFVSRWQELAGITK